MYLFIGTYVKLQIKIVKTSAIYGINCRDDLAEIQKQHQMAKPVQKAACAGPIVNQSSLLDKN